MWETYEPITLRENDSGKDDVGRAKHILRHLGPIKADRLTQKHVDEYVAKRGDETSLRGGPPAPATLCKELGLVRRMLNRAVKRGELRSNPLAGMTLPDGDKVRQRAVDEAEFQRLVDAADRRFKPILIVAYDTGMRRSEVLKLKWRNVDLTNGVIRLGKEDTKTDKPRLVVLTDRVHEVLEALPRSITGYVFPNPKTRKPWTDIKKVFQRACEGAGIKGLWFHDLRRSFVTNARRRGVAESVVMKMSGHKTRAIFDRYNIINDEDLRTGIERIEEGRRAELAAQAKTAASTRAVRRAGGGGKKMDQG